MTQESEAFGDTVPSKLVSEPVASSFQNHEKSDDVELDGDGMPILFRIGVFNFDSSSSVNMSSWGWGRHLFVTI